MPCVFCNLGICIEPEHGVVAIFEPRVQPKTVIRLDSPLPTLLEPQPIRIFDINRSSRDSIFTPSPTVLPRVFTPQVEDRTPEPVETRITVHGVPLRDYLRYRVEEVNRNRHLEQWAKKPIQEKRKTGDKELVGLFLQAWNLIGQPSRQEYAEAMEAYAKVEKGEFLKVTAVSVDDSALKLGDKLGALGTALATAGGEVKQFLVNLCLVNFRTAMGGRLRKTLSVIRFSSTGSDYTRPFEGEELPSYLKFVLSKVAARFGKINTPFKFTVSKTKPIVYGVPVQKTYHPPVRFTVSFLDSGEGIRSFSEKYAFLGSFGFAEPSFSTWHQGFGGGEYAGIRLSPGVYAMNPDYLKDVSQGVKSAAGTQQGRSAYEGYGGVSKEHLSYLSERFLPSPTDKGVPTGVRMSVAWIQPLLGLARKSVALAGQTCLAARPFFEWISQKIDKRGEKLEFILSDGGRLTSEYGLTATSLFDKVWILEATLWEFVFLGVSVLSMDQISGLLGGEGYTPAVWPEHTLVDELVVGAGKHGVVRVLFPTGTAAANKLHEALKEAGCAHIREKFDPLKPLELNPFKPYFEFYIPSSKPNEEETDPPYFLFAKPTSGMKRSALWVNLSENLHGLLVGKKMEEVGPLIGAELMKHLKHLGVDKLGPDALVVVADFTKFCGEMPNSVVYPILMELSAFLSKVCDFVFLRSNLKYNTGTLDRYQSGEVLLPERTASWFGALPLLKKSLKIFEEDVGGWNLLGQYVPLMRKTYLLSDFIQHVRWKAYLTQK